MGDFQDLANEIVFLRFIVDQAVGHQSPDHAAVVFLASAIASYVTNAILPVDGGRLNAMSSGSQVETRRSFPQTIAGLSSRFQDINSRA